MASEKHKAPSKEKYDKHNPVISFRLPLELKETLDQKAAEDGVEISAYIKKMLQGFKVGIDDLNDAQFKGYQMGVEEGFQLGHTKGYKIGLKLGLKQGYNKAKKEYEIAVYCKGCSRLMTIVPNSEIHQEIVDFVFKEGYCCMDCSRRI